MNIPQIPLHINLVCRALFTYQMKLIHVFTTQHYLNNEFTHAFTVFTKETVYVQNPQFQVSYLLCINVFDTTSVITKPWFNLTYLTHLVLITMFKK